jgi:hypothetical protein
MRKDWPYFYTAARQVKIILSISSQWFFCNCNRSITVVFLLPLSKYLRYKDGNCLFIIKKSYLKKISTPHIDYHLLNNLLPLDTLRAV